MSKGERTKARIIQRVAPLFNERGYFGTSLSDIMSATELQKGGIYRHFGSKDELALAAFDFAFGRLSERYAAVIRRHAHTVDRLLALIAVHGDLLDDPYLAGGCPVLNTATESDDAHPALHERARKAMDIWRETLRTTVEKGVARGEMKEVDADEVASVVIATLEGAVMLSKLYGNAIYLRRAVKHLQDYVKTSVAA